MWVTVSPSGTPVRQPCGRSPATRHTVLVQGDHGARAVPADLDGRVVRSIDHRLDDVQREHSVRILWAVESGSRAWGFPSPDSDYDARFLFLRPTTDYLSPWLARDVIETPLDGIYDVNGWDLRKALDLMTRGNATPLEWLRSPIVYGGDPAAAAALLDLAHRIAEPELLGRHYASVGRQQWERSGAAASEGALARLKGVFYAVRPAAVLHWMSLHADAPVPPMRLQALLDEAPPPAGVVDAISELLELKAQTREMGAGPVPDPIRRFVDDQLYAPRWEGTGQRRRPVDQVRAEAADAFRALLDPFPA